MYHMTILMHVLLRLVFHYHSYSGFIEILEYLAKSKLFRVNQNPYCKRDEKVLDSLSAAAVLPTFPLHI